MSADPAVRPLSKAKRKLFADLGSRAGRERHGLFLLEGPRAIEDALARGARFSHLVVSRRFEETARRWIDAGKLGPGVEIYHASETDIGQVADTTTPQGIAAVGRLPRLTLGSLPGDPGPLTLLVDGVQNPGNLGTLLRTLVAVGGHTALCARGTVDAYSPKALRGAAGATFDVAIAAGLEAAQAVTWCAERDVTIVALAAGAPDLFRVRLPVGPLALAVGSEAAGLSSGVEGAASLVAGLPMSGDVESLSVAVAGSIALYVLAYRLTPREDR